MIELYLVRHGETEENVAQIMQGHLPGHLTTRGKTQVAALREQLVQSGKSFDVLLASDLQRTLDTAAILNEAFQLPLIPCPLLRERDWGSATGISLTEAQALKGNFPADTESIGALYIRATQFLRYLFEHHDNQRVLAVGHGLFNRCILATLACQNIRDIPRMHNAEVRSVTLDRLPAHLLSDEDEIATD